MSRLTSLVLAATIVAPVSAQAGGVPSRLIGDGDFDFYVLSLSWSPGFCDTGGAEKSTDQCAVGAGQGFVVHGLWPNRASGQDPQSCRQGVYVPGSALGATEGLYPSRGLAVYEYRKHGTCSGLDPAAYFAAVKYARDQVAIPDAMTAPTAAKTLSPRAIRDAFLDVNPDLSAGAFSTECKGGELTEVRFCVAKDLSGYVDCPRVVVQGCRAGSIRVAPVR